MRSTRDPDGTEIERLRGEVRSLNEQMERLVRTEKNLSESRHQLDQQVQRMRALSEFALNISRAGDVPQMLGMAIETLFSIFPFEQGVGFVKDDNGNYVSVVVRNLFESQPSSGVQIVVRPTGNPPSFPVLGPGRDIVERYPPLDPFVRGFGRIFSDPDEKCFETCGILSLGILPDLDTGLKAVLLLRRITEKISFLERLPQDDDAPFLALFTAHLASAMQSLLLYEAVRASERDAHVRAEENERLYREAREAVRGRDEFLALASHELRTPLTSLKNGFGLIENLAKRDELAACPRDRLCKIIDIGNHEITRLARLVDGMLDVTRITSGHLQLSLETIALGPLIREMVDRLQSDLAQSQSSISLDLQDREPGYWDRLRVEQVVTNLLTNAIKYGRGRPIAVTSSTDGERAVIEVRDQGIGIDVENQRKIFNRFERAAAEVKAGGLGLGLFLTKQIVQAHHGVISVKSQLGHGSTFRVELPLRPDIQKP